MFNSYNKKKVPICNYLKSQNLKGVKLSYQGRPIDAIERHMGMVAKVIADGKEYRLPTWHVVEVNSV